MTIDKPPLHPRLGPYSADVFLREYWHRRPCFIEGAWPLTEPPVSADELAGFALDAEVESRLVTYESALREWRVEHGPFTESRLTGLPETDVTLLVQALDLWHPSIAALFDEFDFLPTWRRDDVMASWAAPGGGVGPHYDHYDVFLLQISGEREWRLGKTEQEPPPLLDADLRLIPEYEPDQTLIAKPGDLLYVPPKTPHWGTAISECVTLSFGYRAPTLAALLDDLAIEAAMLPDEFVSDPALTPEMSGEAIDEPYVDEVLGLLNTYLGDRTRVGRWLAAYMSRPKYPDLIDSTGEMRRASYANFRYVNGEEEDDSR